MAVMQRVVWKRSVVSRLLVGHYGFRLAIVVTLLTGSSYSAVVVRIGLTVYREVIFFGITKVLIIPIIYY